MTEKKIIVVSTAFLINHPDVHKNQLHTIIKISHLYLMLTIIKCNSINLSETDSLNAVSSLVEL